MPKIRKFIDFSVKFLKLWTSFLTTLALVVVLDRSWNFGNPIPPLGKFLNPFGGFWVNVDSRPPSSTRLAIKGLHDRVTVVYDSAMIPHIFANNNDDLYFTQGYVTARDRLWQMDFQTQATAGRLSEVFGKAALDFDRSQRRQGLVYAAQRTLAAIESDTVASRVVSSYGAGVNAYIKSLKYSEYPIEYKLLGYAPEPWTTMKFALLQVAMAKTLNTSEKDLEMTNGLKLFGKKTLDILYPDNERVGDPIVDNKGNWKFNPIQLDSIPPAVPDSLVAARLNERPSPNIGSNNWAVAGSRTATGYPLLCNDPHLNLTLPSIWYVIHLNAPGINAMGASFPGAPMVIIGFNDSVAWGETNAQRDVVDWYAIQFRDTLMNEYLSDGAWIKTNKQVEKFVIKGSKPFYDTIVFTRHGPVVYDRTFHGKQARRNLAYRWISHDPSLEIKTFIAMNRAKNFDDYMKALENAVAPAQNYVFASNSGDIAIRVQGKFPVRRPNEGKFILDGTKTSTEWKAFIPNSENAMSHNPTRGFVSSANQYPVDETYPYYINGESYEAYRNRRINEVLSGSDKHTAKDMMKLQLDNFNMQASENLPTLLSMLDTSKFSPSEAAAFRILKTWDFENSVDSEAASYYEAWWTTMMPLVWDEMLKTQGLEVPTQYTTSRLIREMPSFSFFDIQSTPERENAADVARKSFSLGVEEIEKWKADHRSNANWADYKDTFIGHLLRGLPAFSYHVRHGGNESIVNATTRSHGPSWRMIVSLEKPKVRAWGTYPGGQSGNPGSRYYSNLLTLWARGEYLELRFPGSVDEISPYALSTTALRPE